MLKQTPLHARHLSLGAKMMAFAGYDMPLRYTGDTAEHNAVRQAAGMFDVSHMGEFLLRGPGALPLIQHVTTNDASKLVPGQAQYSCLPNATGGVVDDIIVYRLEDELYMIVANAANIQKDWDWITSHNHYGAQMEDISDRTALLVVAGPKAVEILAPLTDVPVAELKYYSFAYGTVAGVPRVLVATTGYNGERGFELFVRAEDAATLWDRVMEAGQPLGLQACGLAARDTLRLEMGYLLYGNDMNDSVSPLEAGLGWITKLDKGTFVAREIIADVKAAGTSRRLVALKMEETGGFPRAGYKLYDDAGQEVGHITSGGMSPSLGIGIAMGYVPTALAQEGTPLKVGIRDKMLAARIAKTPLVHPTSLTTWLGK